MSTILMWIGMYFGASLLIASGLCALLVKRGVRARDTRLLG